MTSQQESNVVLDDRIQNILNNLSRCKVDIGNESEECKKLRETNSKLQLELKELRELEKSHRYHLLMSREMVGNLQDTVSQLVHLKRDVKKLKEQLMSKESSIADVVKERENAIQKQTDNVNILRNAYEKQIEELNTENKKEIQQIQHECDAQVAQFTCVIEELRAKMRDLEAENRDKINLVVLEYEEKLQREVARANQLEEQLARETARTDLNIDAYRRRLEELEEKLKQNNFNQYLQRSNYSLQYDSQVERPYSSNRNLYSNSPDLGPVRDIEKSFSSQNKPQKSTGALQVIYYDSKTDNSIPKAKNTDKKGLFTITKKRKLYNEKDFQDF